MSHTPQKIFTIFFRNKTKVQSMIVSKLKHQKAFLKILAEDIV